MKYGISIGNGVGLRQKKSPLIIFQTRNFPNWKYNYFHADHIFRVCGKDVVVSGDMLADALKQLPPEKRDIILLSYFLEMTDAEIGKELNTVRQNISKRRNRILALMREYLEKEGFEWPQT